jgi:para-aminobenzoate synthetase / 4-amino-4-deoxychorismate lyase
VASAAQHQRPDPREGVFETILVRDDRPVELEAHLARLAASVRALYDADLPDLRELVRSRARGGGLGRMRLSVQPRGGELEAFVLVAALDPGDVFPTSERSTRLTTLIVDRGYGAHKWSDRALLTRAEAAAGPGATPLLVRADGLVLEASRANVFAVHDGCISTPPLDGSILPGVAREQAIEVAEECALEVAEAKISLTELGGADEVFLTNSLRGVEPVRAIDDAAIAAAGPITTALAATLRRRWLG